MTGIKGPNFAAVTACTTATHYIGLAMRMIQYGDADVMIAGGAEYATIADLGRRLLLDEGAVHAQRRADEGFSARGTATATVSCWAMAPASLVLEEYEHAKARGARIYCELAGFGMSGDAYHMTAPSENGDGAARCMRNAHARCRARSFRRSATSTRTAPRRRRATSPRRWRIKSALGDHAYKTMVSSTKSMTGHLLGAAGGVEAIFSVLALHTGIIPPTINLEQSGRRLRSRLRAEHRAREAGRHRDVELVRLRRHQRHAGFQARVRVRDSREGGHHG